MRLLPLLLFALATPLLAEDLQLPDDRGYLGSETCITCHQQAGEDWRKSHHALAWTEAEPGNIVADFDGTSFHQGDMEARFSLGDDGKPRISVTEIDGITTDYPVHSVIGIEPLQQYVLETEPGRLQSFDVVWDTEQKRWFHLYPESDYAPDDSYHWTGTYKNWNSRCAACHATGYSSNYDADASSYASTQVEIGVGCEACHGPGADHVEWVESLKTTTTPPPPAYGFPIDMSDPAAAIDQCGGCHARREPYYDGNPPPGTAFNDAYNLVLLHPDLYEADGQILDEVYVYGSFLQSKMYAEGVTCSDCHLPHEATRVAEGNAVCTQCHSPAGNPRFPSLPLNVFDGPEHTHHPEGSDGAMCKNCHMVERVYMGNDWRADHSFRIPRPALAATTGAPDACTTCHENRTAQWAADQIAEWFPDSDKRGPHYGEVLAAGRSNPHASVPQLDALASAQDQPGLVRATALWLLDNTSDPAVAEQMVKLFDDPDPLVRAAAARLQRRTGPEARSRNLPALLDDPVRSVRMSAAQALLSGRPAPLPDDAMTDLRAAMADWQESVRSRLDFPETHLQLGGTALVNRNLPAAASAFAEATRLDPQQVDAWTMRVRIALATGQQQDALAILREAIAKNPGALGLQDMLVEMTGGAGSLLPPSK